MSTRTSAEDASLWLTGDGGIAGNQDPNAELSVPLLGPRLRWSKELHEQFLSAVNELGGASRATPKKIWNLMRVEGVTLYHIKSHLQKYRMGKIGRRFFTRDFVPVNGKRNIEDELLENEPMDMEGYQGSSDTSDTIDMKRDQTSRAYFPEWCELLNEDDLKPIVPHFNSLGYLSELPFIRNCNSFKSSTMFGSFFDEVERFPEIEDYHM